MIGVASSEDLSFCFQAAKSAGVDNTIAVARIFGAIKMAGSWKRRPRENSSRMARFRK